MVRNLIETVAATGSTNADLAGRIARGERLSEGHWLVADRQTAGRGRHGRNWCDGAGNFMGSTVAYLRPGDPAPGTLALVAGLAVLEAVSPRLPAPHRAELKWPNDLLIAGAKLAGILLERVEDAVVVGVGVNLSAAPDLADRATVALSHFGPVPDRDSFAADLSAAFAREIERWRHYGLAPIVARWQAAGHPVGTRLCVSDAGAGPITGTFAGLGENGALRLLTPDGTTHKVYAGEVNLA